MFYKKDFNNSNIIIKVKQVTEIIGHNNNLTYLLCYAIHKSSNNYNKSDNNNNNKTYNINYHN